MDQVIQRKVSFRPFSTKTLNNQQKQAVELLWQRGNLEFLLHPGQKRMLNMFQDKSFGCALTCRQIGKCEISSTLIKTQSADGTKYIEIGSLLFPILSIRSKIVYLLERLVIWISKKIII